MGITQRDIKVLWGRAASRCSICGIELTPGEKSTSAPFVIGEQAHIVADDENGPRGDSSLTPEQRNSYSNLILLCPNHHTEIDIDTRKYSVEFLHWLKDNHEMRMQEKTAPRKMDLHPVTSLIELMLMLKQPLKYIYNFVPSQDAENFLSALQTFWASHNISIKKIDVNLAYGIECMLRPLSSFSLADGRDNYPYRKLHQASSFYSKFAEKKKNNKENFTIFPSMTEEDILSIFSLNFEVLLGSSNVLNELEYKAIQHSLYISMYYKDCLESGGYKIIPEPFVSLFFDCITPYFEEIGFRLPDLLVEDYELEWLRCYTDSP